MQCYQLSILKEQKVNVIFDMILCRALRTLFKVDATEYMLSICGPLRELSSPGKSGSFFYLTNDDRYMIKTMKKAEVKVRDRKTLSNRPSTQTF